MDFIIIIVCKDWILDKYAHVQASLHANISILEFEHATIFAMSN
jgi:hypothetical protein